MKHPLDPDGIDVMRSSPQRRWCRGVIWLAAIFVMAATAACAPTTVTAQPGPLATAGETPVAAPTTTSVPEPTAVAAAGIPGDTAIEQATPQPTSTPHPLAVADTDLPPAPIGFDSLFDNQADGPAPVSIAIDDINVTAADVIAVGVNEDLTFEVPPADQVGWYEFGSAPGEPGSAVLAAHIAYNGSDGVFRYLEDVEIGAIVVVGFDDGTSQRYRIEDVTEYVKEELPDSLFARDGREQLALITCGGTFDYDLNSYQSNTVAIAVPI